MRRLKIEMKMRTFNGVYVLVSSQDLLGSSSLHMRRQRIYKKHWEVRDDAKAGEGRVAVPGRFAESRRDHVLNILAAFVFDNSDGADMRRQVHQGIRAIILNQIMLPREKVALYDEQRYMRVMLCVTLLRDVTFATPGCRNGNHLHP